MKSILISILFITISIVSWSQSLATLKKIEVSGRADMEIIPDEIYISITLKEYQHLGRKRTINVLEEELVKAVIKSGFTKENLTIENMYGYNWDWKHNKSEDFLAQKSFKLKTSSLNKLNQLIALLDEQGLHRLQIAEVTHANIDQYKNDLKIKALQNARDKARILLEAIGEELGGAIEIKEYQENYPPHTYQMSMRRAESMSAVNDTNYESDLFYKNIKISAEITAIFEIK